MYRHSRLVGILGCAATLAIVGCAGNSSIAPTTGSAASAQVGATHVAHYMATRYAAHTVVPNSGVLFTYYNGPVLLKPKVYLIFWGYKKYGDPDKVAKLLEAYAKVEGGSLHNNDYIQYYDIVGSKKFYPTNPKGQLGGVWFDNTNQIPQNPTDIQVGNESLAGVAHFGYDGNASYVVATAHDHSTVGFGTQWCAYHSGTQTTNGNLVSYTNLPYMPDAGGACGADYTQAPKDESAVDEGVTIVEGHEYGESITDPNPGTGWYNFEYGEIGDICAWTDIQNDTFGKKTYTMQPMYSNASESCVQEYQ
ncbi:MAG TPA: hypothetical protein VKR56_13595 [Candidatus Cybelea sp.]|nr:hypothetical protein [Candidatus Cybelea sp.]